MPIYNVEDTTTGRKVKFEWSDPNPPTDADMEEVFAQSRTFQPEAPTPPAAEEFRLQPAHKVGEYPDSRSAGEKTGLATTKGMFGMESVEIPYAKEVRRGVLEYGGMTAAGLAGMPAAVSSYGVAPVTLAGAGYAAGKKIADILEGREPEGISDTIADITSGATQFAAGEGIGPAIGATARAIGKGVQKIPYVPEAISAIKGLVPKTSAEEIRGMAATQLERRVRPVSEIAASEKEAQKMMGKTGAKFTRGAIMNDQEALALERELYMDPKSPAAVMSLDQKKEAARALRDYYEKRTITGEEGVKEVIGAAKDIQTKLKTATDKYTKAMEAEKMRMATGVDPQVGGKTIHKALSEAKDESQRAVSKMYDEVPNVPLKTNQIQSAITTLKQEAGEGKDLSQYPWNVINRMESEIMTKGGKKTVYDEMGRSQIVDVQPTLRNIDLKTLTNYDQQINEIIRDAQRGIIPDRVLGRNVTILKNAIEKTLDMAEGELSQNAVGALKAARQTAKEHADKFYQGTVADILQRGSRGELTNIPMSEMAATVFRSGKGAPEAADELIKAVGPERARNLVKDYALQKFLKDVPDPTPERMVLWGRAHAASLQKLRLKGEFESSYNNTKLLSQAKDMEAAFEQTSLAKIIGPNTDQAISAMYGGGGKKSSAAITQEVLNALKAKGDKAAIAGFKNSFAQFLKKQSELGKTTFLEDPATYLATIEKLNTTYAPAIALLYKDEPGKIAAMRTVQKGFEILSRQGKNPLVGSDTGQNVKSLFRVMGGYIPGGGKVEALVKVFNQYSIDERNKLLTDAMFNPEFAKTLIEASKAKIPPKLLEDRINSHLVRLGIYESGAVR